jgi:hypothetical protein
MSYPNPMGRVRLTRAIRSEDQLVMAGLGKAAPAGAFLFTMNEPGAVSVILAGGELLGVKPDEFEWDRIDEPLTDRQRGGWISLGKDPTPFMRIAHLAPRLFKLVALIDQHGDTMDSALAFVALFDSQSIVDAELVGIETIETANEWRDEVRTALNALRDVLPPADGGQTP